MASQAKAAQQLARQLFNLSMVDGSLSGAQVAGCLEYVEKHAGANSLAVLKAYQRLVAAEVARGRAVVEHAGTVSESVLASIASAMSRKYGRKVEASSRPNPSLLAGLRVHVGDDIYETSVAGQISALAPHA